MRICIFEDGGAIDLQPLTLTRPVFDLRCGLLSNFERLCAWFQPVEVGLFVRPNLAALCGEQRPNLPINDMEWLRSEATIFVNGRWLPPADFQPAELSACGSRLAMIGGTVAYAVVTPAQMDDLTLTRLDDILDDWRHTLPRVPAGGMFLQRPWDLVDHNAQQIAADFNRAPASACTGVRPELSLIGPVERLRVAPTAQLEPHVVADTRTGPVVIDADAIVAAFTRLEGPCYVGCKSQVFGAKIRAGTSIGPNCRVGGEVEASIMHGFSNKYHEGFLGHSYVGEWVNMGAGAQTSDLRHDYGEVLVTVNGLRVPTGSTKVGAFIGDHTKIGLGCLLNSGTMLGAFAGVLPAGKLLPKDVPSFCAVLHGEIAPNDDTDVLFTTAEEVMRRRGVPLSRTQLALYRSIFEQTAAQRRQAIRDDGHRRLRRSA